MIDSTNGLSIYEIDGKETKEPNRPMILIKNHQSKNDRIILVVDGKKYTVIARLLEIAIENATNIANYK